MNNENDIPQPLLAEFSSKVILGEKQYVVISENFGGEEPNVVTRAYLNGEIISSRESGCDLKGSEPDIQEVDGLMDRHHRLTMDIIREDETKKAKAPTDFLDEAKDLIRREKHQDALKLLGDALEYYPENPSLLSYYGCMSAVVEKDYEKGISACIQAIKNLKHLTPLGQKSLYPMFHLNLGRAYVAAGNKTNAMNIFKKGLAADKENPNLLMELSKLGKRKKPLIPFLKRSNPINKYLGKLIYKFK
jgi:tetratricopeptide (TPR) repeat protein